MKTLLTAVYNLMVGFNPVVRLLLAALTIQIAINSYVNSLWAALFTRIGTMTVAANGSVSLNGLGFFATIFPLDTMCTLMTAYFGLLVTCAGIRIVKSFIPTIA